MLPHKLYPIDKENNVFKKIMQKITYKSDICGTDFKLGKLKAINRRIGLQSNVCYFHYIVFFYITIHIF